MFNSDSFIIWVQQQLGVSALLWIRLWETAFAITLYFILSTSLKRLILKTTPDPAKRYFSQKVIRYFLGFVFSIILLFLWVEQGNELATYIGILSAGLAIALQDPIANFAGWLFIILRRPFSIGDRIEVGSHRGDVIDSRLFMFTILEIGNWVQADQSTGRIIHIPNSAVFKQPIANYNQGFDFLWNEIPIVLTFESDWKRGEEILTNILKETTEVLGNHAYSEVNKASSQYSVHFKVLTPIVWVAVEDFGICLTLRYVCKPRERRSSEDKLWRKILDSFSNEPHLDFAYPTQRYFDNRTEGKQRLN